MRSASACATSSTTCRRMRSPRAAARLHRRRRLPHPQPQGGPGHERLDAGRFQSRLEARRGSARRCRAELAAHLFGRTAARSRKELIDFDRKLAAMFSAPPRDPANPGSDGVDPAELQRYLTQQLRFTAGVETRYRPSIIRGLPTWQHLAAGLPIGKRFHSAPVIRLADARPLQIGHVAQADGRWRLYVFTPVEEPAAPSSRLHDLCAFLAASPRSPIRRFTPPDADIDAVIDLRAIFQQRPPRSRLDCHALLAPASQGPLRPARL